MDHVLQRSHRKQSRVQGHDQPLVSFRLLIQKHPHCSHPFLCIHPSTLAKMASIVLKGPHLKEGRMDKDNKGDRLTEEKIAEFKEAFQLFDKDNDHYVNISELPLLVRSLNQIPTEAELKEWAKVVDRENKGKFEFSDFLALMANEYKEPEAEDELIEAMQSVFKPQGATITVKEFRQVMGNLGEQLSQDELNQLFKELKMEKEESFNYEEFIKTILTR